MNNKKSAQNGRARQRGSRHQACSNCTACRAAMRNTERERDRPRMAERDRGQRAGKAFTKLVELHSVSSGNEKQRKNKAETYKDLGASNFR